MHLFFVSLEANNSTSAPFFVLLKRGIFCGMYISYLSQSEGIVFESFLTLFQGNINNNKGKQCEHGARCVASVFFVC